MKAVFLMLTKTYHFFLLELSIGSFISCSIFAYLDTMVLQCCTVNIGCHFHHFSDYCYYNIYVSFIIVLTRPYLLTDFGIKFVKLNFPSTFLSLPCATHQTESESEKMA